MARRPEGKGRKDEYRHRGRVTSRRKQKSKGRRAPIRCVLTLAFQAFGLYHVIQFLLHPRSVLRSFAALPQHPGPRWFASPDCLRISAESPVGKKSRTEGGAAVFPAAAKTSTGRGEGARNPTGAGLSLRAPKCPPFSLAISSAEAICFCSFPPQSCGSGNCGTGFGGCRDS